ncbi:retrotransposable element ORF2 protein [Plecturocebus cupreus]
MGDQQDKRDVWGREQWLMPVIPALWENEVGRLPEVHFGRLRQPKLLKSEFKTSLANMMKFHSCCPGWSAMVGSRLTATSTSLIQAILLPLSARRAQADIWWISFWDKWDLIKLQSFCTAKETIISVNQQPTEREKIFAIYPSDKGLTSKIYEELKQIYKNKTNKPIQKLQTMKLLQENTGGNLQDISPGKNLLSNNPQAWATKKKMDKWDHIKFKCFCTVNGKINKMKRQPTEWKKIFANYPSDKGLISGIYRSSNNLIHTDVEKAERNMNYGNRGREQGCGGPKDAHRSPIECVFPGPWASLTQEWETVLVAGLNAWPTPIIPALWEAEVGRPPEAKSSAPAWPTWLFPKLVFRFLVESRSISEDWTVHLSSVSLISETPTSADCEPSDIGIINDLAEPMDVALHRLEHSQLCLILDSKVISSKTGIGIVDLQNDAGIGSTVFAKI